MAELSEYSTTTPVDTALEGDGAGAVRDLADSIKDRVGLDHNFAGNIDPTNADCDGYHNKVTLKKLSADPDLLEEEIGAATISQDSTSIGTATISQADPCIVTKSSHGLATGDAVYFTTTGALPTGLTASTPYYVVYIDTNTFYLSDTFAHAINGSDKIATTSAGSGTHTLYHYDDLEVTLSSHGLADGDHVFFTTTGALPDPLVASTVYYINYIDDNTFSLHRTFDNADDDEYAIESTDAGSGTHTCMKYSNGVLYSKDSDGDSGLFFKNAAGVAQIL